MKKLIICTLLITCFGVAVLSASNRRAATRANLERYEITIEAPQKPDATVNLIMHFFGRMFAVDTIQLNSAGRGTFQGDRKLREGMYSIYFPGVTHFEVLVSDDQQFTITLSDTTDMINNIKIRGAEQSQAFQEYVQFVFNNRREVGRLRAELELIEDRESAPALTISGKISSIDEAVLARQRSIAERYQGQALGVIMRALIPVVVPEMEHIADDSIRQVKRFFYNRDNFFANMDLSDPRLLQTNILSQRLEMFLGRMLVQSPDTITKHAIKLIEQTRGDSLTFQHMVTHMMNHALRSNIMGMDAMTVALADKYFFSGQATWADSTFLSDLDREVRSVRHNLIGARAHNLLAETLDGRRINLYDLPQDFILIYFYDPNCGHCRVQMPILYRDVFQRFREDNFFEVFAFYMLTDREEWEQFVEENQFFSWTNVWDPRRQSNFWTFYDTRTTPGIFLLNREREIIAKRISTETLVRILENEKARR